MTDLWNDDNYIEEMKWIIHLDDNISHKDHMSYFANGYSKLYLYWINTQNYEKFLNELNEIDQIFDYVEDLTIYYDVINYLPPNMHEFKNLTKLKLKGTRWWGFQIAQVPITVKDLCLKNTCNLDISIINDLHLLENLEILQIEMWRFNEYLFEKTTDKANISFEIPSKLKIIELITNADDDIYIPKWKQLGIYNPLFININIDFIDYSDSRKIIINLK